MKEVESKCKCCKQPIKLIGIAFESTYCSKCRKIIANKMIGYKHVQPM